MRREIAKRLNVIESHLQSRERTFYHLCEEWHTEPERRPQLALEAGLTETAADFVFTTGLKYGEPQDARFPFASWSMDELHEFIRLTE